MSAVSEYLKHTPTTMRIATYNLRFDKYPDKVSVKKSLNDIPDPMKQFPFLAKDEEAHWSKRRLRIASYLRSEGVHLVGMQEALVRQVKDLKKLFGKNWGYIGVGIDDGGKKGQFNPIFYNKKYMKLISKSTFWFTNTPFKPSKNSGADHFRSCTIGTFRIRKSKKKFTVINAHLEDGPDHNPARQLAASMILYRAKYEAVHRKAPVFIMGDWNSPPKGTGSAAYKIMTGEDKPVKIGSAEFLKRFDVGDKAPKFKGVDLRGRCAKENVSKNWATHTGFTLPNKTGHWARIDYIFAGSRGQWQVNRYSVGTSLQDDGMLASDHRPVFANVKLAKKATASAFAALDLDEEEEEAEEDVAEDDEDEDEEISDDEIDDDDEGEEEDDGELEDVEEDDDELESESDDEA